MKTDHWQDWISALVGVWLFGSPWFLEHTMVTEVPAAGDLGMWNFWIVGLTMIVVAETAVYAFSVWVEWVIFVLGAWVLISPWVLGFTASAALIWTSVIAGTLVIVLASWVLAEERLRAS